MRFGLYKLQQPLPRRDDWILVVDHTIEFGAKSCLVVLAVSAEKLRKRNYQLRHQDMDVAVIKVGNCTTGEDIARELVTLSETMGPPAQIVSDAAPNLKAGFRKMKTEMTETHPETVVNMTYDITHKTAILLKHLLEDDEHWKAFNTKIATTKRRVVHTEFAAYAPNKPRNKSRWQNLEIHVAWAEAVLNRKGKHGHPTKQTQEWSKKFNDHYGWVREYRRHIAHWRLWLDVLNAAQREVKTNGLSKNTAKDFEKAARKIKSKRTSVTMLKQALIDFFNEETESFKDDQGWLGSSDIIESIFGKYKIFSAKTPMKEVGKTVLTIPVLTSKVTASEVKRAMEAISDATLKKWIRENLGESLFAKRKREFLPQKQKVG